MHLDRILIVTPEDYHHLKSGGVALVCNPFPNGMRFMVLPQGEEDQLFIPEIFIEIVNRDTLAPVNEPAFLELINSNQEQIRYKRSVFTETVLHFVRTYTFSTATQIVLSHELGFNLLGHQLKVDKYLPLLSEESFTRSCLSIRNRQAVPLENLERISIDLISLCLKDEKAQKLHDRIRFFLKESSEPLQPIPDWIREQKIIKLGDRSIEQENCPKSSVQAGTDFENICKQALEFLGFSIDYQHKGGAGGLDLLCSKPYPLFGECKSGKSIPNDTAVQLLNLGTLKARELFDHPKSIRLIIGAGNHTGQLLQSAQANRMSIIHPPCLQKLVELNAQYPNSVNLMELRNYFISGLSDTKIDEYVQKVKEAINLRSKVVAILKSSQKNDPDGQTVSEVRAILNISHHSNYSKG